MDKKLMDKVKQLVDSHYEENLKEGFYDSELVKSLEKENNNNIRNVDWETSFFIWHHPSSNINEIRNLSEDLR